MENTNNNSNGRGIFLAVVSVATLIVTAIGATFAYFVASASGNNGAVAANSISLAGTLTYTETKAVRTDLIPVTEAIMKQSYALTGANTCTVLSKAGGTTRYGGCSTYTFTVTNTATVPQTIYIKLTPKTNTFVHLHYALFTADPGNTPGTAVKTGALTQGSATAIDLTSATLTASGGNVKYTVALWIEETEGNQTTDDAGKSFTGTVSVTSANGENYITGVITQ